MLSKRMKADSKSAKRWVISGRVQGVGFRYFAQRAATELNLTGYVRNLEDGGVEVYAAGPADQLARFAALLQRGPRGAMVRAVEEEPAEVLGYNLFEVEP
ncbi:MAG TPA: acylphosphatase [Bryobacteraceae bacterium]|nr:acylphosphatase [Bryobacteraceae bacterium]